MDTPSITPAQYGAGGLFLTIALACITANITGTDLLAYLGSSSIVTTALVIGDAALRRGRTQNIEGVLRAKAIAAMAQMPAPAPDAAPEADADHEGRT